MSRALIPVALCGLLLAGCVTTDSGERQTNLKKAADENVKLGMGYMNSGQLQVAKTKLETAEKQDPTNFKVYWAQASLSERIEKPAEAERYYKTAIRLAPDNSEVANAYAVYLCKAGKAEEAVPLFETVMRDRLYSMPYVAATNAGMCLKSGKRYADAVKYLELALSLRSDHTEAVIQLADVQLSLNKAVLARQIVDRYLTAPNTAERGLMPDVLLVGARAALAQGDRPAADNNYGQLLRRNFPQAPQTQVLAQLLQ